MCTYVYILTDGFKAKILRGQNIIAKRNHMVSRRLFELTPLQSTGDINIMLTKLVSYISLKWNLYYCFHEWRDGDTKLINVKKFSQLTMHSNYGTHTLYIMCTHFNTISSPITKVIRLCTFLEIQTVLLSFPLREASR